MADMDNIETDFAPTTDMLADAQALDAAIAQARDELSAMQQSAASADQLGPQANEDYSVHEVYGVGRYAIPRYTGWKPLLEVIHDPAANIDYSVNMYPGFDAILDAHFQSSWLSDPLDDHYESMKNLRDNIAAVRNFLMQTYYASPLADTMSADKAKQALAEIAAYVGDGFFNNYRFLNIVPNHNPGKPFIDLDTASQGGGAGAQYIYEKILEMHRQSSWMRPFNAILEFFGGKPNTDWMLPDADATRFTAPFGQDIAPAVIAAAATQADIDAAAARVNALEAERERMRGVQALNASATDLDALANHLLFTAEHMDSVEALAEPVKSEAIAIARDILQKLKIRIGNLNILDGLNLKPSEDLSVLGAVKGVVMVYERLVAWGRGQDGSIMQHPAIMAATNAIGQLGYLAKREAFTMANAAGNTVLAQSLADQLSKIPAQYATSRDATFGALIDKVNQGINTVLNRVQTVSGPSAKVGFSAAKELGSYMGAAPIAGQSMQLGADASGERDAVGKRNAAIMQAEEIAAQATAARIQSQNAARDKAQGNAAQPSRSATGRQAVQQARSAQQRPATSTATTATTPPPAAMNAAQRQQMAMRNTALRAAASAHDADEQHQHDEQMRQAMRQINLQQLQKMQKSVSTMGVTGAPVAPGRLPPQAMAQRNAQAAVAPKPATPAPNQSAADKARENPYAVQPPVPPGKSGGRGF